MNNAIIIRKRQEEATWELIKTLAADGRLGELLQVGDALTCQLKTGEEVTFELADMRERAYFVLRDCLKDEKPMNKTMTNKGGWKDCWMREWLNGTIIHLLPEELQEIIVPRTIRQLLDGEAVETEDKLWLPSYAEMFGRDEDWAPADAEEEQFKLYTTEKSRVKECGERGTWWYWLRSPYGSNSTGFCIVNSSGAANDYNASLSNGVAFGFCV